MLTAGVYSSTLHYLKAVQAAGTDDAKAVMAKMREMPVNDVMTKNGKLREDGRLVRDMYLFQVKSPAEVQEQGRHLQAGRHRAGRQGLPSAQGRQVPVREVAIRSIRRINGKGRLRAPFSLATSPR